MKVESQKQFSGEIHTSVESLQQKKGKTIFVGNLKLQEDPIIKKRNEARKQANMLVENAFNQEKKIDDAMQKRSENIKKSQENIGVAQNKISKIETEKVALKDKYSVSDDSAEEMDLKLLEKERDSKAPASTITLTEEENNRLAEIKKNGITEYQSRSLELDKFASVYKDEIESAKESIMEDNAIIRGVKTERLKNSPMLEATQASEELLKNAGDEIYGMLIDEAKEHIDTTIKEQQKKAEENAKEIDKQEEFIDQVKEKSKQQTSTAESKENDSAEHIKTNLEITSESIMKLEESKNDISAEVEDIVQKMKLVAEDLKGLVVDSKL